MSPPYPDYQLTCPPCPIPEVSCPSCPVPELSCPSCPVPEVSCPSCPVPELSCPSCPVPQLSCPLTDIKLSDNDQEILFTPSIMENISPACSNSSVVSSLGQMATNVNIGIEHLLFIIYTCSILGTVLLTSVCCCCYIRFRR